MPEDAIRPPTAVEVTAHEMLVANLRTTHALEKQMIAVLEQQLDLMVEYPELHARLTEHIVETRDQARRLEAGLEACGGSTSSVRDTMLSVMGLGQSSVAGLADDAVLKGVAADMMQERLEIATYRTLITLADMAGKPELLPRLKATLREEEAMATWFDENLEAITRRFVELKAAERDVLDDSQDDDAPAPPTPAPPVVRSPAAAEDSAPVAAPGLDQQR